MFVALNIATLSRRHTLSGSYFIYIGRTVGPLAGLIAGLRKSLDGIHKERTSTKLTGAEMGMLDERRNNLLLTIAALDDRLSAVQGLIDLGRPHVIRVH